MDQHAHDMTVYKPTLDTLPTRHTFEEYYCLYPTQTTAQMLLYNGNHFNAITFASNDNTAAREALADLDAGRINTAVTMHTHVPDTTLLQIEAHTDTQDKGGELRPSALRSPQRGLFSPRRRRNVKRKASTDLPTQERGSDKTCSDNTESTESLYSTSHNRQDPKRSIGSVAVGDTRTHKTHSDNTVSAELLHSTSLNRQDPTRSTGLSTLGEIPLSFCDNENRSRKWPKKPPDK
jgi:hypothetical protein